MDMSKECSHAVRKRARDFDVADLTYESKQWRDWIRSLEYLLNQIDEPNEEVDNSDRLLERTKNVHDEIIGIPVISKAEFMDTPILNVHEADVMSSLRNSTQGYSIIFSDCHAWDLKASQGRETFMHIETSVKEDAHASKGMPEGF
eukprot:Gb_38278 [translate_table: standard]